MGNTVRFNLEAQCEIFDNQSGKRVELFVGAPCRTEYTIARRNLFQVPSAEFRYAFSRTHRLTIAKRPSTETELTDLAKLSDVFQDYKIDIREFPYSTCLTDSRSVVEAALAGDLLNARSTYQDAGKTVTVEFPVNLINLNESPYEFQVCTGPIILPDLKTWDGEGVSRVFLAHVAFTEFDYVEFILQREVEAAPHEQEWLDKPRGRDRLELLDPNKQPPNYPPPRPKPTVYNEVWEFPATNVILRTENK